MKEVLLHKVFKFHFTEVGYPVSSYSQVENWTETVITAAAEPAFEPAILALGSWGPGADPSELVSSEPGREASEQLLGISVVAAGVAEVATAVVSSLAAAQPQLIPAAELKPG